jgi:integrase
MDRSSSVFLTKREVDAAEARGDRYHIWDTKLAGFGLRVEKSGTKTFVARYRADGGGRTAPRRFVTVGRFGVLTVDQARKRARMLLGAAAKGDDPASERRARRREMTMSALIDLYEAEGCVVQRGIRQGEPMKARTRAYTLARLRHHVTPLLGHKRVSEINAGEIERFARDVAAGKTARDEKTAPRKRIIVRGGDGAARKVIRDLSAVFSFAVRRGVAGDNPVARASVRKTDNRRERYLTLEEVRRLGAAFNEVEAAGANPKGVAIARLWALTGCRRDEIAGLKWSEVDFERGLLILDDSKTGKSVRPLGAAALALLETISQVPGTEYVFPAEVGDGYYQSMKRLWARILRKAALAGVTPHTLRHTIGSTAVSSGEAFALTGAILGHANPRSTAIYAHVQHDPSRRAADRVSKKIAEALSGNPSPRGGARRAAKLQKPKGSYREAADTVGGGRLLQRAEK